MALFLSNSLLTCGEKLVLFGACGVIALGLYFWYGTKNYDDES